MTAVSWDTGQGISYLMKVSKPQNWGLTNFFLKLTSRHVSDLSFFLVTKACSLWLLLVLWVLLGRKLPPKLSFRLIFYFVSAIMFFQNVGIVTIEATELIPYKF